MLAEGEMRGEIGVARGCHWQKTTRDVSIEVELELGIAGTISGAMPVARRTTGETIIGGMLIAMAILGVMRIMGVGGVSVVLPDPAMVVLVVDLVSETEAGREVGTFGGEGMSGGKLGVGVGTRTLQFLCPSMLPRYNPPSLLKNHGF